MYIVTIGVAKGKKYLTMWGDGSAWDWTRSFKDATRFVTYQEARDAMRLAVSVDKVSDATIYGYM